jgi:hypothetical protein
VRKALKERALMLRSCIARALPNKPKKSIRQHTSAYVSVTWIARTLHKRESLNDAHLDRKYLTLSKVRQHFHSRLPNQRRRLQHSREQGKDLSAYVSICQHMSVYVSIRQHAAAYGGMRQHTSAYVSIRQHTCSPRHRRSCSRRSIRMLTYANVC